MTAKVQKTKIKTVTIVELARAAGICPKEARRRMRRTDFIQNRTPDGKHVYAAKLKPYILEIIGA
jgi:hypothetical protein